MKKKAKVLIKCGICPSTYKLKSSLNLHMFRHNRHNLLKIHKCYFCLKSFSRFKCLEKHLKVHTKETPYICYFCKTEFKTQFSLFNHLRRHTLERPLKCNHCHFDTTNSAIMNRHKRNIHSIGILAKQQQIRQAVSSITHHYNFPCVKNTKGILPPGFNNRGEDCYMTSLLQVLFTCRKYRQEIISTCVTGLQQEIKTIFQLMLSSQYPIDVTDFHNQLINVNPVFQNGQHDVVELFQLLLDEDVNISPSMKYFWGAEAVPGNPFQKINMLFKLPPVEGEDGLLDGISTKLSVTPTYLIFQILRNQHHSKNSNIVNYPVMLDISPIKSDVSDGPNMYKLRGLILHYGTAASSGHYTSIINTDAERWAKCDDTSVKLISETNVLADAQIHQDPYLLLYERVNIDEDLNRIHDSKQTTTKTSGNKSKNLRQRTVSIQEKLPIKPYSSYINNKQHMHLGDTHHNEEDVMTNYRVVAIPIQAKCSYGTRPRLYCYYVGETNLSLEAYLKNVMSLVDSICAGKNPYGCTFRYLFKMGKWPAVCMRDDLAFVVPESDNLTLKHAVRIKTLLRLHLHCIGTFAKTDNVDIEITEEEEDNIFTAWHQELALAPILQHKRLDPIAPKLRPEHFRINPDGRWPFQYAQDYFLPMRNQGNLTTLRNYSKIMLDEMHQNKYGLTRNVDNSHEGSVLSTHICPASSQQQHNPHLCSNFATVLSSTDQQTPSLNTCENTQSNNDSVDFIVHGTTLSTIISEDHHDTTASVESVNQPTVHSDHIDIKSKAKDSNAKADYERQQIGRHQCRKCTAIFITAGALRKHNSAAHNICNICQKSFKRNFYLTLHMEEHAGQTFKCPVCSITFLAYHHLRRHKNNHLPKTQQCDKCSKKFRTKRQLIIHNLTHSTMKLFKCNESKCTYKGKAYYYLQRHKITMHSIMHKKAISLKPYSCPSCIHVCTTSVNLKKHQRRMHGPHEYKCNLCSESYMTNQGLEMHIAKIHFDKVFKCQDCSYAGPSSEKLRRHRGRFHGSQDKKCHLCSESFESNHKLKIHIESHSNNLFKCDDCQFKTPYESHFKKHRKRVHGTQKFLCHLCPLTYKYESSLKIHMQTHSSKLFSCNDCKYKGNSSDSLRCHRRRMHRPKIIKHKINDHRKSHPDNQFECKHCHHNYQTIHDLTQHSLLAHTAQVLLQRIQLPIQGPQTRKYKCHICPSSYKDRKSLRIHLETHSGKLFKCPDCKYAGSSRDYLRRHCSRMHRKQLKKYKCYFCFKIFKSKQYLMDHVQIHTLEKSKCPDCKYKGSSNDGLTRHRSRMHGSQDKKHMCKLCPKAFRSGQSLTEHVKRVHRYFG